MALTGTQAYALAKSYTDETIKGTGLYKVRIVRQQRLKTMTLTK